MAMQPPLRRSGGWDRERAKWGVQFFRIQLGEGDPVVRRELEMPIPWPAWQDVKGLVDVPLGFDRMESTRGDDREDGGSALGVCIAAVERPSFATDHQEPPAKRARRAAKIFAKERSSTSAAVRPVPSISRRSMAPQFSARKK